MDPAPADQLTDEQAARILAAVDHPELDPLLEAGRQGEYEVALTEAIEADKADHA